MNTNLRDIILLIKSDFSRYGENINLINIIYNVLTCKNHSFNYCFWLRLASRENLFFHFANWRHKKLSKLHGIYIHPKTRISYGLCLGHGINIVVNPTTIIGENCNINHNVTIASNHGQAAVIGNNVYIAPSVCIIENIKIGDNATIGAGAIVVKDIDENATAVGIPAKAIHYNNPARYIDNKHPIKNPLDVKQMKKPNIPV